MAQLREMKCGRHNLVFAFDAEGVRDLGGEPALMGCPLCDRAKLEQLTREVEQLRAQRDVLLKAIDLKALLAPVEQQDAVAERS